MNARTFILDTDIFTLFTESAEPLTSRILARPYGEVAITAITLEESLSGWYAMIRKVTKPDLLEFYYDRLLRTAHGFAKFPSLNYTLLAIARNDLLKGMKLNIGGNDMRIGAIALENAATVVTANVRDFKRIPGLNVEDWTV